MLGSKLTNASGWFNNVDVDGDGLYDNNLDCWWIIVADMYRAIIVNITRIDVEYDISCGYDYLKVMYEIQSKHHWNHGKLF